MAGLDQLQRVGFQEGTIHADLGAVGQDIFRVIAQRLDIAENIIPAATVQPNNMVFERVKDFIHFKSGR